MDSHLTLAPRLAGWQGRQARHVLVFCCGLCVAMSWPRAADAIDIVLTPLAQSTHPSAGGLDAENPAGIDPDGSLLAAVLENAAGGWEDIFEDAGVTIELTWLWDNDLPLGENGNQPAISAVGGSLVEDDGILKAIIRFNTNRTDWWFDPTPAVDSEFDPMQQTLYRDLSDVAMNGDPSEQDQQFLGNVPDLFEASFTSRAPASSPANGLRDAVTIARHEMGHAIGMASNVQALQDEVDLDLAFDIDPSKVAGSVMEVLARGHPNNPSPPLNSEGEVRDPTSHLVSSRALMGSNGNDRRKYPAAADILALSLAGSYDVVDLPRKDFLAGGDWNTAGNWLGGQVPGTSVSERDDVFIRHGGVVTLSAFAAADDLLVDEGSTLSTQANNLSVTNTTTIGGQPGNEGQLTVNTGGQLNSGAVVVDQQGRLVLVGGSTVAADQITVNEDAEVRGNGTLHVASAIGTLTSSGLLKATSGGELVVTADNNIALELAGTIEAIEGDVRFETGMLAPMSAKMTVGAGRQVAFNSGGTIGTSGSLQLAGSNVSPATSTGSNLFVGSGAFLNANGLGVVENTLILQPSGSVTTESGDPHSEIRLNGTTFFQGGNLLGHGIARQNGDAWVMADTTITIDTYDMDGQNGNTIFTIAPASTLVISSPHLDIASNDFDGTFNVNSGTLHVAASWLLDGTINLGQTDSSLPTLTGAGILTIRSAGQLNVSGAGLIDQQVIVEGGVFADGEANFDQITSFTSTATVVADGPGDAIDLNGVTTIAGGSYTGNGAIKFDNQVFVTQNTSIGMADTDLDGDSGTAEINIQPNVTFSVASINLDLAANDGFDGVMNNQGAFASIVSFRLDGQLNMSEFSGATVPTLNGLGSFTIFGSGEMNTEGDAIVNRNTTVQGDLNVGLGLTQINGAASFESTATVTIAAGGELELNGATTFWGGSYTGAGLIQLNALTQINSATTLSNDDVDLDGASENTQIAVNNTSFVLNVDRIDVTNNLFAGTIDVTGNSALLEVNLGNPLVAWRLTPAGRLNFDTSSASPVTMLDGSDLSAAGTITTAGRVGLGVNVDLSGSLTTADASTDVHFGGEGRSFVSNTATVSGAGGMTVDNGSTINLENGALVGIDVENEGRLEIGFLATEVRLDVIEPGAATIRGAFAQTSDGELAVDLGGLTQATEFDWLDVIGPARLNGTIKVQLIDDFLPAVGDTFQVLTATSVVNTFDTIVTSDENNLLSYQVTPIYSATDVVLQIDDIFLAADFNHDDDVDGKDFLIWQLGVGLIMEVDNTNGDANGDGIVDNADLSIWQSQYGSTFSGLAAAAVPEPTPAVMLIGGLLAMLLRRDAGCPARSAAATQLLNSRKTSAARGRLM